MTKFRLINYQEQPSIGANLHGKILWKMKVCKGIAINLEELLYSLFILAKKEKNKTGLVKACIFINTLNNK